MAYGYTQINIQDITKIQNGNNFYNFKGLNFLSKINPKNKNIAFIFHGSRTNKKDTVIFRGYDYNIENTDIICISDYLLSIYKDYIVNWTLSTTKYNVENIYKEVIGHYLNKKYEKVIMTGTSAGGYPSIKFACYFNAIALIGNSQIYIERYAHFENLKKMVESDNDTIICEERSIEKIIKENKPKKIIIYNNRADSTYNRDILPLNDFINQNNLESYFDIHLFDWNGNIPKGKTHHHIQFPNNKKHIEILKLHFLQ